MRYTRTITISGKAQYIVNKKSSIYRDLNMNEQPDFLPMLLDETKAPGFKEFDIILATGDAYVDHPSFGTALVGRMLWDAGYKVGRHDLIRTPSAFRNLSI